MDRLLLDEAVSIGFWRWSTREKPPWLAASPSSVSEPHRPRPT